MKGITKCQFNMDTGCVEVEYDDGNRDAISCTEIENKCADNRFERAALDYLIYNDPVSYAELVLYGDVEEYLKNNTDYTRIN